MRGEPRGASREGRIGPVRPELPTRRTSERILRTTTHPASHPAHSDNRTGSILFQGASRCFLPCGPFQRRKEGSRRQEAGSRRQEAPHDNKHRTRKPSCRPQRPSAPATGGSLAAKPTPRPCTAPPTGRLRTQRNRPQKARENPPRKAERPTPQSRITPHKTTPPPGKAERSAAQKSRGRLCIPGSPVGSHRAVICAWRAAEPPADAEAPRSAAGTSISGRSTCGPHWPA